MKVNFPPLRGIEPFSAKGSGTRVGQPSGKLKAMEQNVVQFGHSVKNRIAQVETYNQKGQKVK